MDKLRPTASLVHVVLLLVNAGAGYGGKLSLGLTVWFERLRLNPEKSETEEQEVREKVA